MTLSTVNLVSNIPDVRTRHRNMSYDQPVGQQLTVTDIYVNYNGFKTENSLQTLVRHSLLHFHLSHMAVHHHPLHHLHDHHLHLLLLVQSFTLNMDLDLALRQIISSIDLFLSYRTDYMGFYSAQRLDLFAWCVRLSRL